MLLKENFMTKNYKKNNNLKLRDSRKIKIQV